MQGSSFSEKDSDGKIITSLDGYNAYLLIIDRYSRYTCFFNKRLKMFFHEHNRSDVVNKKIRTDKGGELWASSAFRDLCTAHHYIVMPTAPDAPNQNGLAERPNTVHWSPTLG